MTTSDKHLRATFSRIHAVLTKLERHRPDPQRQRTLAALEVLLGRRADDRLTPDARDLLDFVREIEESPLGTPQARELRNQTPPDSVSAVLIRAAELNQAEVPVPAAEDTAIYGMFDAVQYEIDDIATSTMTTLVSTAMAGDPSAIESLLIRIQPAIVRYCRFRIGRTTATGYASADDVAQEICLAVLNELARYDDEPDSFLAFVYQMAAAKVTEHYGRHGDPPLDPHVDHSPVTTHADTDPPRSAGPNPPLEKKPAPKVFVSWAHDSTEHKDSVVQLATWLRSQGIEATLDVWSAGSRQDWAASAVRRMTEADFVIVVASTKYQQLCDESNRDDLYQGVQHEAALVRDLVGGGWAAWMPKVLPVLLPGHDADEIPSFLRPHADFHYRLTEFSAAGAGELLRLILDQPRVLAPPVAPQPTVSWRDRLAEMLDKLPPRQREVLELRTVAGLSAQETADILQMAPSSVRVVQHRALQRLRRAFRNLQGGPSGPIGMAGVPVGVGARGDEDEGYYSPDYQVETTTDVFGDERLVSQAIRQGLVDRQLPSITANDSNLVDVEVGDDPPSITANDSELIDVEVGDDPPSIRASDVDTPTSEPGIDSRKRKGAHRLT